MKLALIGYGKMGHAIEQIARSRGHEIVSIIDVNNPEEFESEAFRSADVAIEFTAPSVALGNYRKAFAAGVPVVSGTTGWLEHLSEIQEACRNGQTFFYASNFSLGVNIFFALNKYLAGIMNQFPAYDVKMEETHHIHKLDAPSGTAITLAEGIIDRLDTKQGWVNYAPGIEHAANRVERSEETPADCVEIRSVREGAVPGIHTVSYESEDDRLEIRTLAAGAVVAAEFLCGKRGVYGMDDLLK